jgi:hypothetical protein
MLADHLQKADLLNQETRNELEERAACRLKEVAQSSDNLGEESKTALERLDESGRVARRARPSPRRTLDP